MNQLEVKVISTLLMLTLFGVLLCIGLFFVHCARRRAHMEQLSGKTHGYRFPGAHLFQSSFASNVFGRPTRWLAIRAHDPTLVRTALHLHHPTACSWEEGLAEARDDKIFITPPVSGWVLVLGRGLPDPANDVDKFYHFITRLSRQLGHVQYFNTNHVLNHHAWVLTDEGSVFRAYAWAETVLWNQGPLTAAEKELNLQMFDYGSEVNIFALRSTLSANCDKVGALAAHWSLDPNMIPSEYWDEHGIAGEIS